MKTNLWMGLELLHRLSTKNKLKLLIEISDWDNRKYRSIYSKFSIGPESDGYRIDISGYHGNTGDALSVHTGSQFSTIDRNNDFAGKKFEGSCSKRFKGGWWYYNCYRCNPTGVYYDKSIIPKNNYDGIAWKPLKPANYSMKYISFSIQQSL